MPYKKVGAVKNATIHAALGAEIDRETIRVTIYGTQRYEDAEVVVTNAGQEIYRKKGFLSPTDIFEAAIPADVKKKEDICVSVYHGKNCWYLISRKRKNTGTWKTGRGS